MVRRLIGLVTSMTSDDRLEWLVVASVLVLIALAMVSGLIRLR